MKSIVRYIAVFLISISAAAAVASVFSTQFVIAGLNDMGVEVPLGVRLATTFSDLHILRMYVPIASVAFLVAFLVAGTAVRWLPGSRQAWFLAAGFAALFGLMLLLSTLFGSVPVAGARSFAGMLLQGVAGAVGGWLFARLTAKTEASH